MPDLDSLTSWHSDWKNLRALVFGLGVSGFSAADTFAELGVKTLVVAEKAEADLLDILDVIGVPFGCTSTFCGWLRCAISAFTKKNILSCWIGPDRLIPV